MPLSRGWRPPRRACGRIDQRGQRFAAGLGSAGQTDPRVEQAENLRVAGKQAYLKGDAWFDGPAWDDTGCARPGVVRG